MPEEIGETEAAIDGYEQSRESADKFIALVEKNENFDMLTTPGHKHYNCNTIYTAALRHAYKPCFSKCTKKSSHSCFLNAYPRRTKPNYFSALCKSSLARSKTSTAAKRIS